MAWIERDRGRQSLTRPRWDGLLLARVHPPLVLIRGRAGRRPRIEKSEHQFRML